MDKKLKSLIILKLKNIISSKDFSFIFTIQILIKQQYLICFLSANKFLYILLATKMIKKNQTFFPKASAYRIDFDENEFIYFMIKEEKIFDKYMKIWKKVSNIMKKTTVNLNIVEKSNSVFKKIYFILMILMKKIQRS